MKKVICSLAALCFLMTSAYVPAQGGWSFEDIADSKIVATIAITTLTSLSFVVSQAREWFVDKLDIGESDWKKILVSPMLTSACFMLIGKFHIKSKWKKAGAIISVSVIPIVIANVI